MVKPRLVPRGGPATTILAHQFDLHCYLWPKALGDDPRRWRDIAAVIDKAAQHQHKRDCPAGLADGRTTIRSPKFEGDHAWRHRHSIEMALVDLLEVGIPSWLTGRDAPLSTPSPQTVAPAVVYEGEE